MGLFGPSKSERLQQRVSDVEIFYNRLIKFFVSNLELQKKPNNTNEQMSRSIFSLAKTIRDSMQKSRGYVDLLYVKDLFEYYPDDLLPNDHDAYTSYLSGKYSSSFTMNGFDSFDRYYLGIKLLSRRVDSKSAKSEIVIKFSPSILPKLQEMADDFFSILSDAIVETAKNQQRYPSFHLKLLDMYFSTKGALAWFNYLDKISM